MFLIGKKKMSKQRNLKKCNLEAYTWSRKKTDIWTNLKEKKKNHENLQKKNG
jgi:hypothetical protein